MLPRYKYFTGVLKKKKTQTNKQTYKQKNKQKYTILAAKNTHIVSFLLNQALTINIEEYLISELF